MQAAVTACLDARTRSVWGRPCPGAPPFCPMQKLSRTPQTRPINDRPPTQTCWSAACAYAERHEKRRYQWWRGLRGFEPRRDLNHPKGAGSGAVPMQPPGRCTTQYRPSAVRVPRNSEPGSTFGFQPEGGDRCWFSERAERLHRPIRLYREALRLGRLGACRWGRRAGCWPWDVLGVERSWAGTVVPSRRW